MKIHSNSTTFTARSIKLVYPSLLSTFQNEWDAIVLEVFTLKKQLQSAKQELSIALYRQDAAVNVAAKAIGKEMKQEKH